MVVPETPELSAVHTARYSSVVQPLRRLINARSGHAMIAARHRQFNLQNFAKLVAPGRGSCTLVGAPLDFHNACASGAAFVTFTFYTTTDSRFHGYGGR